VSHSLLFDLIKKYDNITIFGHVFPDGDCYGSQIGLKDAIKATFPQKQVFAIGSGFVPFKQLISEMDQVSDDLIAVSLAIVVDVGDAPRIEDQRFKMAQCVFKIDHHIPVYDFGHHAWIDTDALAVSLMIARFVRLYHMKLTPMGANALALGLITDSGRFLFGQVTGETFSLMSDLIGFGATLPDIYRILYEKTFEQMAFQSYVYQHYETNDAGLIYVILTSDELKNLGITAERASSKVNLLAQVKNYHIWTFFAESAEGYRCEIRSDGIDIQAVASKFGGGGHQQASGCLLKSKTLIPNVIDELVIKLREHA
jgi:phosphoesterase RecJ-like protein